MSSTELKVLIFVGEGCGAVSAPVAASSFIDPSATLRLDMLCSMSPLASLTSMGTALGSSAMLHCSDLEAQDAMPLRIMSGPRSLRDRLV